MNALVCVCVLVCVCIQVRYIFSHFPMEGDESLMEVCLTQGTAMLYI